MMGAPVKKSDVSADRRHWMFACKYVELNYNGTKAYQAIYDLEMPPETAGALASRLLKTDKVVEYLARIEKDALDAAQVTASAVIARYQKWASFDASSVFSWKLQELKDMNGNSYEPQEFKPVLTVKDPSDVPPEAWECIESISQGKDGFKINIVNRKGANDQLAKILGIEKNIHELSGRNGDPIETVQLDPDQYAVVRKEMLKDDDC